MTISMIGGLFYSMRLQILLILERFFCQVDALLGPIVYRPHLFEKLDRVLVSTEYELKYPHTTIQALTREISDHTHVYLYCGETSTNVNTCSCKFELGWLLRDGFFDMVKDIWLGVDTSNNALECWQGKIGHLR